MKKSELTHSLLWVVLIFILSVQPAYAGDRFIIKPMITSSYEIDSNFYRTDTHTRSVRTLTLSPGLEFGYRTEKSRVAAKGMVNLVYYDDLDTVPSGLADSDENNYTGHWLTLSADTRLFTRITLGLDDTWITTRNPDERDRFDNFTDVNKYMINRIRPWIKYKITDRLSTGFEFKNTDINYNVSTLEDSSETGGKIKLYYEVNKFTTLDLEYALTRMNYDLTSSDYDSDEYRVNFSTRFKYFEFAGGLGYHKRQFDQAGLNDIGTISWDLSVKGKTRKSDIDLSFAQNFNDTGNGNEYYRADRISLALGHMFMEKIDVRLDTYYQKSAYEGAMSNRDDDTWYLSVGVSYSMNEWLTLKLKSGLESRDSSIALNDYDNSFVMFTITFNYNLGSR